jgi:MYXO-CTERM domain-containing protein
MNPTKLLKSHKIMLTSALAWLPVAQPTMAQVLASESIAISSGAGGGGGGAQTSCMIMSDGTSWSGGAVGVQGASSTKMGGGSPTAANVTFKYNVGSVADSLNSTYGAGNWTVANAKLTLQYTLYANNTRFGGGAGTFSIYWVGNDSWVQGTSNPAYATSASSLGTWSTSYALLGSENYSWSTASYTGTAADATTGVWVTDKSGGKQATISYGLALDSSLVNDLVSASATSDPNVSLYLMSTSSSLGLTIFTGGGSVLPTLTFDVVSAPEPSSLALGLGGLVGLVAIRRWKLAK